MATRTSGEEAFAVTATLNGTASNHLPFFYTEFATADVPDVGKATIGIGLGGGALYVMLPGSKIDGPPHLFTLPLKDLAQAALAGAVRRYKTGEGIPSVEVVGG